MNRSKEKEQPDLTEMLPAKQRRILFSKLRETGQIRIATEFAGTHPEVVAYIRRKDKKFALQVNQALADASHFLELEIKRRLGEASIPEVVRIPAYISKHSDFMLVTLFCHHRPKQDYPGVSADKSYTARAREGNEGISNKRSGEG